MVPGFETLGQEKILLEFPFKCPSCGKIIETKEEIESRPSYDGVTVYICHLSPNCIFLLKEIKGWEGPKAQE